jgi:hypothetical protein
MPKVVGSLGWVRAGDPTCQADRVRGLFGEGAGFRAVPAQARRGALICFGAQQSSAPGSVSSVTAVNVEDMAGDE